MSQTDIAQFEQIKTLVDSFYGKVREDDLLKDIFNEVIGDRWAMHLDKMYRFWQTILLNEHTYHGTPFLPHIKLPIQQEHFERWLNLFHETVDEHFAGVNASFAKAQAERMALIFQHKHITIRGYAPKQ